MDLHAKLEYSSSGCNRVVGNLCCGYNDVYAYGSHNVVVLFDTKEGKVVMTLLGHQDSVTAVAWVSDVDTDSTTHYLVSGSTDGTVILWKVQLDVDQNTKCPWVMLQNFSNHHGGPVTCVAVGRMSPSDCSCVLVTTGGDGCVSILCSEGNEYNFHEQQRLSFGTKLVHCAALAHVVHPEVNNTHALILAMGFVDGSVQVYSSSGNNISFSLACNLVGHQNWVRGIDFIRTEGGKILLASGSQDRYIRLWSIHKSEPDSSVSLDSLGITKYAPKPRVDLGGVSYDIILESLLVGHEDWVMSVAWNKQKSHVLSSAEVTLLSSSMDRTMILWRKDVDSGIWLSSEVVGDAGINHLGYYTCIWGIGGTSIATHGYTGALHIWDRFVEGGDESLRPRTSGSGHMSEVVDSSWSHDGAFLLTVSMDQTARIFSCCKNNQRNDRVWCEIARPQIHGHDFSCVSLFKTSTGTYRYTSGSEEKVLRIFESPRAFLDTLLASQGFNIDVKYKGNALGAKLPALGLSNKAIIEEREDEAHQPDEAGVGPDGYDPGADLAPTSAPAAVSGPPLEEHLSQNTLWPEIQKLYGHGNDLFCVAADPEGQFLASASRAQSASTAGIIVWDAESWTQICTLSGHTLTVTCLEFSPCGSYLASVGRDRKLCIFKRDNKTFSRTCAVKAHSRVLWGVAWSPDSKYLFTSSRDSTIKCWLVQEDGSVGDSAAATISCESSARTLACLLSPMSPNSILLAAGFDNGSIQIFHVTPHGEKKDHDSDDDMASIYTICGSPEWIQHSAAVRCVAWRPPCHVDVATNTSQTNMLTLSSVGDDHSVKMWSLQYTT